MYTGSKCQRLTQVIPQTQSQNQPRKPNVVVMAGGTNNIAAGEPVTNICENVNKMLKIAQDTYPPSKIMFSSIHHRTDLDDCIPINKKIDAVNNNVKHLCSLRGYMFMDNNAKLSSSHIQQPNDHNEKRLMNSKPQIRNSDIRYKPTHPRQQSVPLCISSPPPICPPPPHQTRIMMRDKYTPVPQQLTKKGNMPQRKVSAWMDLQLNQPHSFAPWTQTPYM